MKKKNNKTDNGFDFEVDFSELDDLFKDTEFGTSFGNGFGTGFGAGFNSGFNTGVNSQANGFSNQWFDNKFNGRDFKWDSFGGEPRPFGGYDYNFRAFGNPQPSMMHNQFVLDKEPTSKPNLHILSTLALLGIATYQLIKWYKGLE